VRRLVACVVSLLIPTCALAAVSVGNAGNVDTVSATPSVSYDHTGGRLVAVLFWQGSGTTTSGCTYDGVGMSGVGTAGGVATDDIHIALFEQAPAATGAQTLACTVSASVSVTIIAVSLTNGDALGTPTEDVSGGASTGDTNDVSSATGDLCLTGMINSDQGGTTVGTNSGQTDLETTPTANANFIFMASHEAGAATCTMGYNWTSNFSNWAHITVNVPEAASRPGWLGSSLGLGIGQ